jgi:hypothetical protein
MASRHVKAGSCLSVRDQAWMRWAESRHSWLWQLAFGVGPSKVGRSRHAFVRRAALWLACALLRVERVLWRLVVGV